MTLTTTLRRHVAAVAAAAVLVPVLLAPPAGGEPATVDDRRAEAARLAGQIESLGTRLSMLDEAYNEARLSLAEAEADVAAARARSADTEARFAAAADRARARAVAAYVDGGTLAVAVHLPGGRDASELSLRAEYLKVLAGDDRAVLDALKAAREDLAGERAALDRRLDGARAAARRVTDGRRRAAAAMDEQRRLLARATGELDALVRAEEARRAAAARAAAEADLARRAARPAPRTTTPPRASRTAPATTAPTRDAPDDPAAADDGPPPSSGAAEAVAFARRQVGKPYEWGAAGPDSYDCSGLTMASWREGGVSLPHSSRAQWSATTRVPTSALRPGDLLFYGSPIHHVGIYVGGDQMIAAPQTGRNVEYQSIWRGDLVGAGRPG